MTIIQNVLLMAILVAIEVKTAMGLWRVFKTAYLSGKPKYDVYYLATAVIGLLVANSCYLVTLGPALVTGKPLFVPGIVLTTFGAFSSVAFFYLGLYIIRNITFKRGKIQKVALVVIEISYAVYLVSLPVVRRLTSDVWTVDLASAILMTSQGDLGLLSWTATCRLATLLMFFGIFLYASKNTAKSEKHSKIFHEYSLFLLYGLSLYAIEITDPGSPMAWVTSVMVLAYQFYFTCTLFQCVTCQDLKVAS